MKEGGPMISDTLPERKKRTIPKDQLERMKAGRIAAQEKRKAALRDAQHQSEQTAAEPKSAEVNEFPASGHTESTGDKTPEAEIAQKMGEVSVLDPASAEEKEIIRVAEENPTATFAHEEIDPANDTVEESPPEVPAEQNPGRANHSENLSPLTRGLRKLLGL